MNPIYVFAALMGVALLWMIDNKLGRIAKAIEERPKP